MLEDFIGQEDIKRNLELLISGVAKGRQAPHLLITGPTGAGKTTLAEKFAKEIGAEPPIYINAAAIINPIGLRNPIATALKNADESKKFIIIIDEAHALDHTVQTLLLSALEKPSILSTPLSRNINIGSGRVLKKGDILRERLPSNVTFIFCTTDKSGLLDTLCNRLHNLHIEEYNLQDKVAYIRKELVKENLTIEDDAAETLGKGSKNMRHLTKLVDRLVDYQKDKTVIQAKSINGLFGILGIDEFGRDKSDVKYINYVSRTGPVSVANIAQYLNVSQKETVEKIEPFLIRSEWVTISKRGRELTQLAWALFFNKDMVSSTLSNNTIKHDIEALLDIKLT